MPEASTPVLRFALIGCGRIAVKHLKAIFKSRDYQLVGIADVSPDAPGRLLADCGLSPASVEKLRTEVGFFTNYQELLEKLRPDVVAVTVPSGLHYRIGKDAMLAGAHILLEKPMTMCVGEARELYEISHATGRKIAMGHIYRYFPVVKRLRSDIASGNFGTISHGSVVVRWGHDQAYYDQAPWRGTWKSDGGALMNQSVHALDLLCWLMCGEATEVSAMLERRMHHMEAEDVALGTVRLNNGALCQIEGTTNSPKKDHEASFYLCGTQGTIRIGLRKGIPSFDIRDANNKKLNFYYLREDLREKGLASLLAATNPHAGIYKDLAEAIRETREPLADARSGFTSVQMVLAMYLSAKEQKHVSLPLAHSVSSEIMTGFFPSQDPSSSSGTSTN